MSSAGIICEYNPFHNGHLHQFGLLREKGCRTIVCLMSGNVTQRGEFAVADKYTRAATAISSGADIVFELPYPYCAASAEFFAAAGICILDALGVDEINFGSENADAEKLGQAAKKLSVNDFRSASRSISEKKGTATGAASLYAETVRTLTDIDAPKPNEILGLSYFIAAIRSEADAELTVCKRTGAGYNDKSIKTGAYPSAFALRELINGGKIDEALSFMPYGATEILRKAKKNGLFPTDREKLSSALLSFFRLNRADVFESVAEAGGGVSGRLCNAGHKAVSYDDFFLKAATKKYTDARLRRAALFCMTGVTVEDLRRTPEYITLLAANKTGREWLNARKNCGLTIVTKPADAPQTRQRELSLLVDSLFTLTLPKAAPSGLFVKSSPEISEKD